MSKKGLFRTHVALVTVVSEWVDGEPVLVANTVWTKGNLQPYKQGISIELTEAGYRYNDWRILYLKDMPVFSVEDAPQLSYFVVNEEWYLIQSKQNWTTQAKGAKHYKLIGQKTPKPDFVNMTMTIGELAQDFENAINELDQATKLL